MTQRSSEVAVQPSLRKELAEHITCPLCGHFLSNAVTLLDCLHFFCRACLLRHFSAEQSSTGRRCPKCAVLLRSEEPLFRADKALQELVYKLVPDQFWRQLRRVARSNSSVPKQQQQKRKLLQLSARLCSTNERISVQLDYIPLAAILASNAAEADSSANLAKLEDKPLFRRYFRCQAGMSIGHLKRLLEIKLAMSDAYGVYFVDEQLRNVLEDDYTLEDLVHLFGKWTRESPFQIRFTLVKMAQEDEDRPPVLEEMPLLEVEGGPTVLAEMKEEEQPAPAAEKSKKEKQIKAQEKPANTQTAISSSSSTPPNCSSLVVPSLQRPAHLPSTSGPMPLLISAQGAQKVETGQPPPPKRRKSAAPKKEKTLSEVDTKIQETAMSSSMDKGNSTQMEMGQQKAGTSSVEKSQQQKQLFSMPSSVPVAQTLSQIQQIKKQPVKRAAPKQARQQQQRTPPQTQQMPSAHLGAGNFPPMALPSTANAVAYAPFLQHLFQNGGNVPNALTAAATFAMLQQQAAGWSEQQRQQIGQVLGMAAMVRKAQPVQQQKQATTPFQNDVKNVNNNNNSKTVAAIKTTKSPSSSSSVANNRLQQPSQKPLNPIRTLPERPSMVGSAPTISPPKQVQTTNRVSPGATKAVVPLLHPNRGAVSNGQKHTMFDEHQNNSRLAPLPL